jgi:hypothetical protein
MHFIRHLQVITGLDPVIQAVAPVVAAGLDAPVKPAHDERRAAG